MLSRRIGGLSVTLSNPFMTKGAMIAPSPYPADPAGEIISETCVRFVSFSCRLNSLIMRAVERKLVCYRQLPLVEKDLMRARRILPVPPWTVDVSDALWIIVTNVTFETFKISSSCLLNGATVTGPKLRLFLPSCCVMRKMDFFLKSGLSFVVGHTVSQFKIHGASATNPETNLLDKLDSRF
ncbi:hypothetical protein CDAR_19591 [Caerostris darwini]|uniref:Uncharacterized protein n=1 Tax=Caerostris darwini TaxID=1538125 RepID=A0AAV4WBW3_9ARAC|nr:hypothetical protein CDAR_19591 [Caerostris darwini]